MAQDSAQAGASLPVVKVDDAHQQLRSNSISTNSLTYEVAAGDGFIFDATGYTFHVPSALNVREPNIIQVVAGANRYYGVDWQSDVSRYSLTKGILMPLYGTEPYSGLQSGDHLIVAVGYHKLNSTTMQDDFSPMWVGLVDVR